MSELVLPQPTATLAPIESSTSSLVVLATALVVESQPDMAEGTDLLAQIKKTLKRSEEARDVLVRPLNDHVKMINAQFKTVTAPLADAERTIRQKMLTYATALEKERQEEAERARRAEQERALEAAAALEAAGKIVEAEVTLSFAAEAKAEVARVEPTTTDAGNTTSIRKIWKHEVVDFGAVPDAFKIADDAKIREAVRAGIREIPGVRIYQEDSLAINTARSSRYDL